MNGGVLELPLDPNAQGAETRFAKMDLRRRLGGVPLVLVETGLGAFQLSAFINLGEQRHP